MRELGLATVAANNTSGPPGGLAEALDLLWRLELTRGVGPHQPPRGDSMNPVDNPWAASLRAICGLLDDQGTSYAVVGAIAANLYRNQLRTTFDVDLLVWMPDDAIESISRAAERRGWEVQYRHPEGSLLRMRHAELGAVDLIAVQMEYQETALQRATVHELAKGVRVPALAIEDVLIHKLIAGRHRDLDDIAAILETGPALDTPYLEQWVEQWEVGDLFQKISSEVAQSLRELPPNTADDGGLSL